MLSKQAMKSLVAGLLLGFGVAACDSVQRRGGIVFPPQASQQLHVGKTSQEEVVRRWGTPSTVSVVDPNTWYYASSLLEVKAFLAPTIRDSQVYALSFDQRGILSCVEHKDISDMRMVQMVDRVTPVLGQSTSWTRQLFRNLGKTPVQPKPF